MMRVLKNRASTFFRRDDGVALVEFAIVLPLSLLTFFVIVEFSRVFYSYQGAVVGVRDATRYLARIAPSGICDDGSSDGMLVGALYTNDTDPDIPSDETAFHIVWRNMEDESGFLPKNVELKGVYSTYECFADLGLRQERVPIARVAADIEIRLPLIGILELNALGGPDGVIPLAKITHTIIDESRIFGV